MWRGGGYISITDPDGVTEYDCFTCEHCQRIVPVPPRTDPANLGGWCAKCTGLICPQCVAKGGCDPWEKQLERAEAKDRFLRRCGLL